MNIKYIIGSLISIPLLPIMYYQGKKVRASVPVLPEAKGIEGESQFEGALTNTLKVLSIGESTIAGVGVDTHAEGFTGTFAKELSSLLQRNVQWKVYARSGYTASRVDKKIIPKITEEEVDLIIIGLGGNDAFTLNSPSKWKNDIIQLLENLQNKFPRAVVVFANMPPIKEFPAFTPLIKFTIGNLVEILGSELKMVVLKYKKVFYFEENISLGSWIEKFQLKNTRSEFFSDGVHPSKLTYQTWAKDIAYKIAENSKIRDLLES